MYLAVSGSERASSSRRRAALRGRAGGGLDRGERRGDLGEGRRSGGSGAWPAAVEHVRDAATEVRRAVVGLAEGARGTPASSATAPRWPTSRGRSPAGRPREGRPVRKTAAIGQLVGGRGCAGSRRGGAVFSEVRVVAATRSASSLQRRMAAMVYRLRRWPTASWFPEVIEGTRVVLRRHVPANLARVPALVRRPRGRPPDALPGRPDAARRDRAVLRRPRGRTGPLVDGHPRARRRTGSSGPAPSASSTATTAPRCTTSRSARRMRGATATAPRRRA